MEDEEITIFGYGKQIRDYIFIDDLVEAMILASVNNKTDCKIYNLGSGEPTKFIDMVGKIIKNVKHGTLKKEEWPKKWNNVETGDFYADISKLKKDINWKPETTLNEGIKKTIKYYKEYKKHYW